MELYVHIPFCAAKCAYCDFLSGPADHAVMEAYMRQLRREVQRVPEPVGRQITSVFVGGGTPSHLPDGLLEELLAEIIYRFELTPDAEITVEVNPGTLSPGRLSAYRRAGVNRLSLGLQSPKNQELALLGRIHRLEDFLICFQEAREAGFSNINVDLMYALPGQDLAGWEENLQLVAGLGPEHISAYSLILEEGTPFFSRDFTAEGRPLPDEDTEYRMVDRTAEILGDYGYLQYEISNYARAGYACRHNCGYWKRDAYIGLGLGAASFCEGVRFSNTRDLKEYLAWDGTCDEIRTDRELLTREDAMAETMFLGLRMKEGVSEEAFALSFGQSMRSVYEKPIRRFMSLGLLQEKAGYLSLTRKGMHVSNQVMCEFIL